MTAISYMWIQCQQEPLIRFSWYTSKQWSYFYLATFVPNLSRLTVYYLDKEQVDLKISPYYHFCNIAEREISIRTWKNHCIVVLCVTNPTFAMNLWNKLIPQASIILNLLQPSNLNHYLSAYIQVYEVFNFNRTPLAPPSTKFMVHKKPSERDTWDPHAVESWYLVHSMHHYIFSASGSRDWNASPIPRYVSPPMWSWWYHVWQTE